MPKTIYQMREDLNTLRDEIAEVDAYMADKAADPKTPIADIKAKKARLDELKERYTMQQGVLDRAERAQRADLEAQKHNPAQPDPVQDKIALHGALYRAALLGDAAQVATVRARLTVDGDDNASGANYLPTQLAGELVAEPFDTNPIRDLCTVTNVVGLEIPKISYTVDDDAFIDDDGVAKELELTGDKVTFGRHKFKVKVRVSDTVMNSSDVALGAYIDNALRSGLATKEKKCLFASSPAAGEGHMSMYEAGTNALTTCTGTDVLGAILTAIGDLPEAFAANAKVAMRRPDYIAMIKDLANGNDTLFGRKPEDVIGYPVQFIDKATTPVVGDFQYLQINYEGMIFDSDKDVNTGDYIFVLTAWFDIQRKLNSAFRLVEVEEEEADAPAGGTPAGE